MIQSLHRIKEDFSPLKGSALILLHIQGTLNMFTAKSILLCLVVLMLGTLFLPVYNVVPTSFGGLSGQSHLVASKLKSQGSKLATFLSILSPGLYLVFSQDDKGVLISKQQNL